MLGFSASIRCIDSVFGALPKCQASQASQASFVAPLPLPTKPQLAVSFALFGFDFLFVGTMALAVYFGRETPRLAERIQQNLRRDE